MADRGKPRVTLRTSKGDITMVLDAKKAPLTTENFLSYVESGHFNGTIFHRVIPDFMIQGGGFDCSMVQKPASDPIVNEADNGLRNERGTVAMARTMEPHSASCQFFINLKDNRFLDHTDKTAQGWGYAVFAHVVEGMDVVDAIAQVQTERSGAHSDVPVEPVVIETAAAER
jgi:peptidyl-prolyl cis-trans isomerase B (cyclophilin B)